MKVAHWFIKSSGALMLAAAAMLFLSHWAGSDLAQPKDPLLAIPIGSIIWIAAVVLLVVAMGCLFGEPGISSAIWLAWLAAQFWVYKGGLLWSGFHHATIPLGNLPDAFRLTPASADLMAGILFGYILVGSLGLLLWSWWTSRKPSKATGGTFKISCVHCNGHVAFSQNWVGRQIACPHCTQTITLRAI